VDPSASGSAAGASQSAFHGAAYRLGDTAAPSEMIGTSSSGAASANPVGVCRLLSQLLCFALYHLLAESTNSIVN